MSDATVVVVPISMGARLTTTRRPASELAGRLAAFAEFMLIGILCEQLEGIRTRTYDGPGGLRRAGRVSGLHVAVVDEPAGSASGQHQHLHDSLLMLRALRTADQCMIRGSSRSC